MGSSYLLLSQLCAHRADLHLLSVGVRADIFSKLEFLYD